MLNKIVWYCVSLSFKVQSVKANKILKQAFGEIFKPRFNYLKLLKDSLNSVKVDKYIFLRN